MQNWSAARRSIKTHEAGSSAEIASHHSAAQFRKPLSAAKFEHSIENVKGTRGQKTTPNIGPAILEFGVHSGRPRFALPLAFRLCLVRTTMMFLESGQGEEEGEEKGKGSGEGGEGGEERGVGGGDTREKRKGEGGEGGGGGSGGDKEVAGEGGGEAEREGEMEGEGDGEGEKEGEVDEGGKRGGGW